MQMETKQLLDLNHSLAGDYLAQFRYPWQALEGIKEFILALGPTLPEEEYAQVQPNVWVHKTAKVFPSAYLGAPCLYPGQRAGGQTLRCRKFCGAKERDPV